MMLTYFAALIRFLTASCGGDFSFRIFFVLMVSYIIYVDARLRWSTTVPQGVRGSSQFMDLD